jgi:hypothetical protein
MGTLADLKARIALEVQRSDQSANIASAISRAIDDYSFRRFWFNDSRGTVSASAEYVSVPTGLRQLDHLFVTVGGVKYTLTQRENAIIEEWNETASNGQPTDFAWVGSQFRLHPVPNQAYTLTALGVFDQPALTDDTSSNAWATEAEDLICAATKKHIYRILRDAEGQALATVEEREALGRLKAETNMRLSTGIKAS